MAYSITISFGLVYGANFPISYRIIHNSEMSSMRKLMTVNLRYEWSTTLKTQRSNLQDAKSLDAGILHYGMQGYRRWGSWVGGC